MVTLICLLIKADVGSNEKILVRLRLCLSYNNENTKQPQIKLYILSSLFDKKSNLAKQGNVSQNPIEKIAPKVYICRGTLNSTHVFVVSKNHH